MRCGRDCGSVKGCVTLAAAVTGRSVLDVSVYLVEGVASELDFMEGFQDAGDFLELVITVR